MADTLAEILSRFVTIVAAPLDDPQMLWAAIPLLIATLFMTLYFGKYKQEELGWNTAFGNTMVFLFVSINIIQYLFYSSGSGGWSNIFNNEFYFSLTAGLAGAAIVLMLITYYHLLPKRAAFFLFSAPPVNVSVYVILAIVYSKVPADMFTLAAAVLLFAIIFGILRALQVLESMAGKPEGLSLDNKSKEEEVLQKLKEKNRKLTELKNNDEKA